MSDPLSRPAEVSRPAKPLPRHTGLWIGFLAGGWAATLLMILLPSLGVRTAVAQDPPESAQPQPPPAVQPGDSPGPFGLPIPPVTPGREPTGRQVVPGGGTADSNNHAIALAASIGGGESVVYYFDTRSQRLLVYQYKGIIQGSKPLGDRDRGGLRLLAARHLDFDLRLEGYRDLSENTRTQLKTAFEDAYSGKKSRGNPFPTHKVKAGGGSR